MSDLVPVKLRDGVPEDMPYVFNSWLKGYRASQPEMRTEDYYSLQHLRLQALFRSSGYVRVLHPDGAPGVIAAWVCLDVATSVVHYVHVRGEYRRKGFAMRLLKGRDVCTHLTAVGTVIKRKLGIRYMPHLLDAS